MELSRIRNEVCLYVDISVLINNIEKYYERPLMAHVHPIAHFPILL